MLVTMKKHIFFCALLASSLLPAAAEGQVSMQFQIGLPVAPPLVVVQPGIQVVENYDEEVFYTGGWYWVRRDGHWFRARRPNVAFAYVEPRHVPPGLVRIPPGHYRHWTKEQAKAERRHWKDHDKAERREWKQHEKAERREWKEHEKAERREMKAEQREHGNHGNHGRH